ncbi:MAG: hypothetical protein ACOYI6_10400 [Christensenellales bacterium]|jgi:hypothetical protein|nr:hypothetical protein [Clostridiales bacterium]
MIKPDQFKRVADETLGGLTAGPDLLNRARMQAARNAAQPQQQKRKAMPRALAMAMSLVLVIGVAALVVPQLTKPAIPVVPTMASGDASLDNAQTSADLPRGSLVLSKEPAPRYQGVWERGAGANFPLVRVDGRFYRMLTHPQDVSALKGGELGQVAVFTDEPALDDSTSLLSNVAAMNAPVYAINGMGKAVVAAEVNGQVRLFQRVAFAGSALQGSEGIKDVIPAGAKALQLSDVGTVEDPALVSKLMDILYQSSYQGSRSGGGKQALLIQYGNGIVLQLAVDGDSLSSAGTWVNPDFFEAFKAAINN